MSKFADALAAGYSKQEIVAFLRDRPGYDARINEALSSGYSEDEIVDHLHRQEFKAINPSATDEDLNYLVNDSIKTARKPRQTEAENIKERVQNRMNAGSSRTGAEQATVFDLNLEEKLRQRRNGLDASVRGDIGAIGMEQNQKWRDANQKLRQDAGRERTWGEAAQDVGVQLLEGGQNIAGAIPDLVAPDSEWAQFHKKAANFWNSKQSEPIKARAQLAGQAIGQAGEDGVIAQVVEAASQYWNDPVLASRFVITNLPSMIPGIGAAKLAKAGALARGATAARAMTAGVVAAGGVNAGLNAGGARGEAYEDIKQTLIKQGMDKRQANEIAKRESIVPAMVGGVTGAFSGSTGLERAFAGGIGRPLMATGAELLGEQAEEVLPKLTTNLVAGRYDGRSPGQDVGRTMVETAIGSAPGAVLAGGMEALGSETPDGISRKGGTHGGIGSGQRSIDDDVSGQFKDDTQSGVQPTQAATSRTGPVYPPAEITERPLAQLSEFEQFIQAEREDISRRRVGMVERQAASQQAEIEQRIPSEVETKDAQVLAARQRTDQEQRLADLERAMRSPNPMATFAELRTSKNQPVLPEDSAILKRRMGQAEAFQGDYAPGVEPSLPDGGMSDMVPERKPVAQSAPAGGNFAAIDNALANGFKVQGKALVHPKTGKKINLNVAEREYLAGLKRGGNQPVTSPGAEDGDADQGGQISEVVAQGVEGSSAELQGSGRATQAGVSGGLPGDGGRAAVPGGSDGSPVPAGTAGTQGVNEFDVSGRTDAQLDVLVKAGKPGWREAAIAEVSKRSKENAASTDDGQAASVDADAHAAATSPTNDLAEPSEGQKKAGNYAKGHTRVAGLDLSIENPEGSTRSGTDQDGKSWSVTMKSHYGYIKGTVGKDKDHLDVFVKPGTAEDWNGTAYVIDQVRPDTGAFDEHKIMLGFADIDEAKAAYRENYAKGWAGLKAISATPMQELKDWIKNGDTTKPFHKAKLKAEVEKARKTDGTKKTRLTPMEDPSVQAMADDLRNLSKQTGWQQEGGRLLRKSEDYNSPDYNEIVGRTKWIPHAEWYGGMATKLRGKEATAAVEKAIAGQPMTAKEKRFVAELADIAQEQAGERQADKQAMDEADAEARAEREAIMAEAELAGLETTDEGLDRILEAAFSDTPGAFTDEEIFGALNEGQEVPGPAETVEPQGPDEGSGQRGEEAGQDAGQAFSLTGQTPEEAQAEEQARADREKADKDAADKAEAEARKKRIAKEVESRQRASAENFQLGQSAEDALAGQGGLLSAPINQNQIDSKTANTSVREKLKAEVEKAKKSTAPRTMGEDGRPSDGKPVIADAEENNQPPLATQDQAPTQDENAPLSDDELSALFDEAAAELAESTQEQPEAPAPGEPTQPKGDTLTLEDVDTLLSMLDETRRDGIAIGGTIPGIPSIHDIGALGKTEHMGYGSFETVGFGDHPNAPGRTEEWRMVWEGGGAMNTLPSGLSYTRVRISGKAASPYPFQQVRQALERMQSRYKLATEVAKARARTTQEAGEALFSGRGGKLPSTAEQNAKIAAELAKEAAKLGVQGIDSALAGLVELFGGSKIKSFPAGFDEEAYAKAKPHFEKALAQFIEAGKTLKDLFKFLIQNFGMGIKPYAMQFAKEKGLASTLGETKQEPDTKQDQTGTPSERLATWVRLRILRRQPITWQELFLMADSEFGGTQAQGVYTPKDAYDAVELGVNQHIIETMPFTDLQHGEIGAVSIIRAYQDVLAMLPTQTKRTAEMDEFQQFSTPPTYAYLANWVANVKAGETFLEPSAGIGGLAVFGKVAGAKVVVNELSARRLAVLKTLPFDHFFAENAEHLASILPQELRPTVVVMNPPFSATAGRVQGERDTMNGAKHIEQALKYMQEGGRLVAIVGEGMAMDRPAFREWWNKIRQQYNVRANLGIDGTGYAKYGTTFDNQILVIDKTGPTTGEIVTGKVQSPADAVGLLEKVREDRQHRIEATQPPASPSGERAGGETVADGGQSAIPWVSGQPTSGADSTAGVGGGKSTRPGSGPSRGGAARPDAPRDGSGPVGEGGRSSPGRGQQPAATDGSQDGQGGVRGDPQPGQDGGGVTLEQVEDRPQADFTNAVFEQYTPKKLKISGAKPHNTPLVESSALATVSPPNPTYTPNLPKALIESGALSDAQLEVVVYAGQAHEQFLENEQRRGFFVGDGTGVGKGREISGIIMDNLRQGRKKAVWISQKKELMEDAKRDFGDIGGDPKIIFGQHKMKGDAAIAQADGILFSTYSLIKGDTKATKTAQKAANVMVGMGGAAAKTGKAMKAGQLRDRTKQIVNWLGEDFDGVIVFDEAHNMGNAVAMKGERGNKEPSEQALAAVALQNALPKARIVYVSATGATEVSNLAYATRLGLWGAGTPFANVGAFVSAMSTSVSAMELVAQNLKQMGLYFSRSLSFDGGTPETRVTYDRLEHALDPYQRDVYNALAQAWQTVLNNIDKALDMTGVNKDGKPAAGGASGKKKGAILSAFWGSHQRFFNQVITALQMPSVIAAVNQDMAEGYAVVMQIVNTNEADQNRALAKLGGQTVASDDGEANEIEELDLTPREQLITFLEKAFPVQKMEVVQTTNPDGSVTKSLNPVVDSEGKPVFDADAMALRQETIDMVRQITIPDAPLQMVINEFGPDRVAEITGRGERVIYDENGKLKTEKRGAHAAANDAQAFKDGKKDILIFSNAGGTGFSFHADRRYKNQKRRKHYVIQPGWSADKAIQGLGRSHRTNQKTAPQYVLVTTDVPAQKRFISTIARRLESMGALTMGQRDTAGGTMFKASDNLESKYATRAVEQFFDNLIASRYAELPAFMEVLKQMGLEKAFDPQTRGANKDGIPSVRQFLNRILSVSLEMQETMMTLFTEEIESQVELAKSMGAFDDGLKTVHHVGATVKREEVINQDERSGAETKFYEIDYKTPNDFYDFDKADKEIKAASKGGWFKNKKSGHVIGLLARNTTRTDKYGQVHRLFGVRRTSGNTSMIEPEIKYDTLEKLKTEEARVLWEAENEKRAETVDNKLNMVVGAILPLWDRFTGEHVNVSRIRLDDGRKLLGRVILPKDVEATLANLNIKTAEALMTGSDLVRAVLDGKKVVFSNQWTAIPVTVSNEKRVEITGAWGRPPNFMPGEAQDIGIIQERIGWQERYFIPSDVERGGKVLDALMRKKAFNATKVGRDEQTKFSRSPGAGIPIRDAQDVVDVFRTVNRNAPEIIPLEDVKKAPDALLAEIKKAGAMGDVEGAFHDGKIYLFANNLASPERVAEVLTHEGRHFAFRAMKGKALDSILMDIYNTNDRIRMASRAKQKELGLASTVEAVEEVLADMDIKELQGAKGWKPLVAHIRLKLREFVVALRRAGLDGVASWLQDRLNGWTDADVAAMLKNSDRFVRSGRGDGSGGTRMSRTEATGNLGTFDPTNPDIRFSRATGNGTLRAKRGPIDAALRVPLQTVGADKLTGGAWEELQRVGGAYVPEVVKAGVVDDYGLSEGYTDARSMMFSHQRQGLRGVQRLMDRVAGLSRAESAILYQAAAYEPDPGAVDAMIAGLPEDSQAALREIKQLVHDLGEEEVMLGLLDAETFERNEWAYLHRSYARWELGLSDQEKAARQKAKSIWGDTFRMRGMKMDINPESIHAPAPWFDGEMKGKKVTVLKKARADGKFSRAVVVGAIPEKYSAWTVDGDWEIIDAKKGNFVVRRDYTPEERQDMGEIEDIRFATVKTLQHMIHNVEVAKFFEWVAATEAADEVPEGGIIADPSESLTRAFKKDEWVLVPDSKLTGTSVKRYGALAGKYVPGPVWNDIRQLANRHYAPFGKTYAAILKAWKISKTALSPAVHMNNVMANLVMADWHDVEATHLLAAIKAMANDDRALIDAFEDNGGSEGMYAISELQREQLQPIIDALEEELSGEIQGQGMVGVLAALRILFDARLSGLMKSSPWREAWEAYRLGRAYKWPAKAVDKMIQLYQDEDTVFRLAAFIKAKEDGLTDRQAGKFASQSFLDYQINAPWIQAMRNTAFPFISFTYRALPMLMDTAAHKPWKLMKLGLTLGALNAMFTAMAGGDDDEDRKYLPVEKSGRVLGFVAPKLIRMPWNGEHDAPVFLDIRRWIPVGDIVDIGQEHSAIPLLPSMMPGGPLVVLGEVVFNTSAFTGKKITKSTDTGLSDALWHGDLSMERYVKVVDHLYKAFMPNIMGLPGTYATAKVADAATGKTDSFGREYSTASAMASGFGVKVAAYPKDVGKLSNDLDYLAKEREIADNIRSLERQKKRKGISREEYRDALKQEMEKLRRAEEERAQ